MGSKDHKIDGKFGRLISAVHKYILSRPVYDEYVST